MSSEWNGTLYRVFLDSSLRAALFAAIVALLLMTVRVRSSSVRHAAWTAVLLAMLLMPVLPYCIPSISVPVPVPASVIPSEIKIPETTPTPVAIRSSDVVSAPMEIRHESSLAADPDRMPMWPLAAIVLYCAVVFILLFRALLGWRAMSRITRASTPIDLEAVDGSEWLPGMAPVYESELVAAPLTAGIPSPKIILPTAWRQWPAEKLHAVLAHEYAHVRRRDPLIALLSHLNRCVFWFHPLAWWLQRKLAATAELACDDEAIRAVGERKLYAEVLLEIAQAVRRRGGRLAWQGVGINGNGLLNHRIDRLLRGNLSCEISRTRKAIVAFGCAAAIFLVVACHQKSQPAALQEDPKVAAQQAQEKAQAEFNRAARTMNPQQVAELEAAVSKNPEDLTSLEKLLIFYKPLDERVKGEKDKWAPICAQVIGEKECIAARRPHILWLIEHHPDHKLAGDWGARIYPTSLDPLHDPAGYEEAKQLWLRQTARPDVNVQVLSNAARFFEATDKPLAEQMLLKAKSIDPKPQWSYALGRLYAFVLLGSNSSTPLNVVRTYSKADANSPYAQAIRKKLAASTDADLLFTASEYLTWARSLDVGFNPEKLGISHLERALELNPKSAEARGRLISLRAHERIQKVHGLLRDVPKESQYQTVSALPESERFAYLPGLARSAFFEGENADYYNHDKSAAKAGWDRAAKYARDALNLAPKFSGEPYHGLAIYQANMILGTLALRNGDKKAAVRYLLEASKAPASEELTYYTMIIADRLLHRLLKSEEYEPVIEFLEAMAQKNIIGKKDLLESAAALRRGQMPSWYQQQLTMGY